MQFDAETGLLTYLFSIDYLPQFSGFAEPSPSGQFLYLYTTSQLAPETMIIQYDLRALDSTQVNDSHFVLNVDVATGVNDITRGPDDKIYVNEDELVLSVINSPNLIGADADYEPNLSLIHI